MSKPTPSGNPDSTLPIPHSAILSRRRFLQGAAMLGAAPYIITSNALGAGNRTAANSRITVGGIGYGNQMRGLIGAFLGNPGFQVVAFCDCAEGKRAEAKERVEKQYGGQAKCEVYHDFREMMARDDLDAVVTAVPDHWHALMSVAAAQAGKDIYSEKPLALTIREGRAMVDAARRYGQVFQTGSMQRSMAEFPQAVEWVRNGRIGKIKHIEIGLPNKGQTALENGLTRPPEGEPPRGFDYNMWLGPAPWKPYNSERVSGNYGGGWRYYRDYSGGMMTDWGAHHFDIAQWALGMDDSGPVEVYPAGTHPQQKTLTYVYGNGVTMSLGGGGVRFIGEEGEVFVTRGSNRIEPKILARKPLASDDIKLGRGRGHQDDFLQCIRARTRPICDVEVGHRSATVCHLGNIATWIGRPFKWDPVKEEVVGDAEANRWLERPMRAPWHL
jgi:predicted dehydrogenase